MPRPMKIAFAATEALPFVRTCDVADFVYNLTRFIRESGSEVKVVMPLYRSIKEKYYESFRYLKTFPVELGSKQQFAGVFRLDVEGVDFLFLDNEHYFCRDRMVGEFDDCERYIFLNKATAKLLKEIDFHPDILHCNNYMTALLPAYMKTMRKGEDFYRDIHTVLSIHNIRTRGIFPAKDGAEIADLPMHLIEDLDYPYYPCLNFLKAGIATADHIMLPSPSFKEEIQTPYASEKLDHLMRANAFKVTGILDGIDFRRYDPERDPAIFTNFTAEALEGKEENKFGLLNYYGLRGQDRMLVSVISRLLHRKGMDAVAEMCDHMVELGMNLLVMGTGEPAIEDALLDAAMRHPEHISTKIYLNEKEAVRILAGSDAILMPSRVEMQATNQLIAMRYGTIPLVRETGALKDSVRPFNKFSKKGEGFTFSGHADRGLRDMLENAAETYFQHPQVWRQMQKNAMAKDSSWKATAKVYLEMYRDLIGWNNREVGAPPMLI